MPDNSRRSDLKIEYRTSVLGRPKVVIFIIAGIRRKTRDSTLWPKEEFSGWER